MIPTGIPEPPPSNIDRITVDVLRAAIHDLKGPSGRLRVLAQLANRSQSLDDDTRTLMNHIADSALALDRVIDALRSYSELCMRPLQREWIDLAIPLGSALANRAAEIGACGAEVRSDVLPAISGDRLLITWLFEELVGNSLRFRGAGAPRIQITAIPGGAGKIISVSDNGPGIETALLERVFRPFKKGSSAGGAGLGLTICSKIVELHGGRIWAEPRTGGADIRIRFCA
jgi:signal transduction histidine kinase